jgi:Protein of unknown function (DUF2752)
MTARARLRMLTAAAIGGVVMLLRIFPPGESGWYPICPFHALTGLLCPLCGMTRALAALATGQWMAALRLNFLVAIGAPVLAMRLVWASANGAPAIPARAASYLLVIAIVFTILRNSVP